MIELNLLEKKKPLVLPTVLGVDLNTISLKMLAFSIVIYYTPDIIVPAMYEEKTQQAQEALTRATEQNTKIKAAIFQDKDIKTQLDAYKVQVTRLQSRSSQVDEILKTRTNPKKILEKIARSIPEDVWFDELNINSKNEVIIAGGSYSPRAIGEFITAINDSPYFGGSVTPSKQENKQENLDGALTSYEVFELRGRIINYDMRSK